MKYESLKEAFRLVAPALSVTPGNKITASALSGGSIYLIEFRYCSTGPFIEETVFTATLEGSTLVSKCSLFVDDELQKLFNKLDWSIDKDVLSYMTDVFKDMEEGFAILEGEQNG